MSRDAGASRAASLPMYGVEPRDVERFWRGLVGALRDEGFDGVPDTPDWPDDLDAHWRRPDLLLSQTCGYPLVDGLDRHVTVLGAFAFAVPGAAGTDYRSFVIVRATDEAAGIADLRGKRAAINGRTSHSGANALRALVAPFARDGRFFGEVIVTGAHRSSIDAVRSGAADVAAIDCVTYALVARHDPAALQGLRVLAETASVPGLPLVTSNGATADDVSRLRAALARSVADPALAESRAALFIAGFTPLDRADYAPIAAMRDAAISAGYPKLG